MTEIYLDENWQQINPQRSVTAATFTQGSILFNFNVSGLNSVSLKDSYFIIKSSLTRGNGTQHILSDKVTYAHNWTSTLFSNVSVRISGQEVSACNQYNHLAHTVKMRQMVDENRLNTNHRDMMDYDIDFTRRLNRHCKSNDLANPATGPSQREDANVELSNKDATNIRNGDISRYTIYQPLNLGVFDLGHGSICGDISILLNPNTNYQFAAVENANYGTGEYFTDTKPGDRDLATEYRLNINSITFMACYAKASKPIDSAKTFQIYEYQVMNKAWADQLEFQVLPSTEEVSVFIQDQSAGNSPNIPATVFKVRQYKDTDLTNATDHNCNLYGKQYTIDENASVQVTLGQTTKPPILLDPSVNLPTESGQVIRWLMTHQYLSGHKSLYERYNDWCASPIFTFQFLRDSSDTSGYVTVRSRYTKSVDVKDGVLWPDGIVPYLFCVSKYSKLVKIEYASGYVTSIQIQNT